MPAVRKVSCFSGCLLYRVAVGEELVWAAAAAGTASIIASTTLPASVCSSSLNFLLFARYASLAVYFVSPLFVRGLFYATLTVFSIVFHAVR